MPTKPEPKPHRFATYPGDVAADMNGRLVGPNSLGELLIGVTADYDKDKDHTHVGFRYATVDDLRRVINSEEALRELHTDTLVAIDKHLAAAERHALAEAQR